MGTSIVVTSGKGGVGKTTTTANLSVALAKCGKKVCMVDLDIGLRNLDGVLGLSNRVVYDILDVVKGDVALFQALVKDPNHKGLYLLAASQNDTQGNLVISRIKDIVQELKKNFDFVILDCPAGIENGFKVAVASADSALIVTTPEIAAVGDADRVVGILEDSHLKYGMHLVINRVRQGMLKSGKSMDIQGIVDKLAVPLIGVIVDNDDVIATSNNGKSVVDLDSDNLASVGYQNLAQRILGKKVPLNEIDLKNEKSLKKKPGFFHRLFHIN